MSSPQQSALGGGVDELVIFRCERGQESKLLTPINRRNGADCECRMSSGRSPTKLLTDSPAGIQLRDSRRRLITADTLRLCCQEDYSKLPEFYVDIPLRLSFLIHLNDRLKNIFEQSGAVERLKRLELTDPMINVAERLNVWNYWNGPRYSRGRIRNRHFPPSTAAAHR
jgi:hypothetical protein